MDIWLPESTQTQEHIFAFTEMCTSVGYDFPPKSLEPAKIQDYGRFTQTVQQILTFEHGMKKMQLIVLKNSISTPREVVKNFDLGLLQMWYDGTQNTLKMTTRGRDDCKQCVLRVALHSDDVRYQSYPEWLRTIARIIKYEQRGFLLPLQTTWQHVTRQFFVSGCVDILVERLQTWMEILNRNNFATNVPMFVLSVSPNNVVFVCMQPFVPDRYCFQIAWEDIQMYDYPRYIVSSCESHAKCITMKATITHNVHLVVFLIPYNSKKKRQHLKKSSTNLVLTYITQNQYYMLLSTRQEFISCVVHVPGAEYVRLVFSQKIKLLISRLNFNEIIQQIQDNKKQIFEICDCDIEQQIYNIKVKKR